MSNQPSPDQRARQPGLRRWGRRLLITVPVVVLCWSLFLAYQIASYARIHDPHPAAIAVVLGAGISGDEPSPVFAARIDHAIQLYQRDQVQRILFTGGIGEGNIRADSEVARDYAIRRGVPASDTLCETRSRLTSTNLAEAKRLLGGQSGARMLIVSDPLHMCRAISLARDLGLDAHPAPTPSSRYRTWRSQLGFLFRETFFYAQYLLGKPFRSA